MKQDLVDIIVPTVGEFSTVEGRNGMFRITKLRVWESHDHEHIYVEGIGKRQVAIRGGLRVTKECFEEVCRRYLKHERGYVLQKKSESEDGCRINPEGFCETCQTVHLRERAAAMEVPAGEKLEHGRQLSAFPHAMEHERSRRATRLHSNRRCSG